MTQRSLDLVKMWTSGATLRRLVERAAADEPHLGASVLAEDRHLAGRTAEDPLLAAVVARHVDRLRVAGEQLHAVGLDQQVDDEGASGLPLAVQAMTAVREERIGRQAGSEALRSRSFPTALDTHLLDHHADG